MRKAEVDALAKELLRETKETGKEVNIASLNGRYGGRYSTDQIDRIHHRYRYLLCLEKDD